MNAQENKQLVMQGYQKFRDQDISGLLDLYSDNIEWVGFDTEHVPFSGTYHGKEGVSRFFSKLSEAMEALQFEARELIAEGNKVVSLGHAVWSVRPTDRLFESDWVHVFTIEDGKVVRFQHFDDTAATAAAFRPS